MYTPGHNREDDKATLEAGRRPLRSPSSKYTGNDQAVALNSYSTPVVC